MKKLLPALLIATFCLATRPALAVQTNGPRAQGRSAGGPDCAATKFHTLGKYKGERWSQVFTDREVAPALRTLLRGDYGTLKESLKEVSYPEDSLSYLDKRGVLMLAGGVPGLYTIMEAELIVEPCGNIYAAILDNGERFLYFTNDQKYVDKLPPSIEQWRAKIEGARSQPSAAPQLPVIFKSR